jgi:signal transduction histidine kinase
MRRSLRALVVGTVVIVAVLPAPLVALLGALGEEREVRTARAVREAAAFAASEMERGRDPIDAARASSARFATRTRALARSGESLADVDSDPRVATYGGVASITFGERADPDPAEREPLAARAVVRASEHGASTSCHSRERGALLVCESAVQTRDRRVAHAQKTATGAAQRLAATRRPLFALTGFVVLSGLALAAWLVRRVVGPLDALRDALSARARSARTATTPIALSAPPEVAEVIAAHNRLLAALEHERREKERLASDLVHEIKSPLAAIRLAVEALDDDAAAAASPLSDSALAAVERIDRTVAMLLELSRAEAGLEHEPRERCSLRSLIDGACATVPFGEGVSLSVRGEDITVNVAPDALSRALACVVDNARSFAKTQVEVSISREDHRAVVRVSDDGPGIPEAQLDKVFERFFSTRRELGGTGVGLALARAVCEAHGGDARAESPPSGGATLVLRIPRSS